MWQEKTKHWSFSVGKHGKPMVLGSPKSLILAEWNPHLPSAPPPTRPELPRSKGPNQKQRSGDKAATGQSNQYCPDDLLIFEWLCFKETRSVCAYLLRICWVKHGKTYWKVSQLLLVVLIPKTLSMAPGQFLKLLHSGVPLNMYWDKLVIM